MHGSIAFKKELDRIRPQSLVEIFEFNENGQQITTYNTFRQFGSQEDTSIVQFEYQNEQLITKRKSDNYGFFSDNYAYDSVNRLSSKTYCRDENKNGDKFNFELSKQYTITSEQYEYSGEEGQKLIKKYFNNYNRPFKEEVWEWDENGYLVSISSKTVIGKKRAKTIFKYNDNGLVRLKVEQPDLDKERTIKNEYMYDEVGNLIEHNIYKSDQQITHRKLLYNEKTMLLESSLSKDIAARMITITKYQYEFYD